MKIEMSDIKSYVEEAPVTTQSVYNIDVDLIPNKLYLLGELTQFKVLDQQQNVLNLSTDRGKTVLQVWGQLYRISGDSKESFRLYKDREKTKTP